MNYDSRFGTTVGESTFKSQGYVNNLTTFSIHQAIVRIKLINALNDHHLVYTQRSISIQNIDFKIPCPANVGKTLQLHVIIDIEISSQ